MRRARLLLGAWLMLAALASAAAAGRQVLDNGLVVITSPSEGAPVVAVEVLIKASALDEPQPGLRQLLQQTLVRGSQNLAGDELARALDDIGAEFDTGLGLDYVEVYAVCLRPDFERALELMAEVVRRPTFPAREVDGQRRVALQHLESLAAMPFETAQLLVRQGLYDRHPYGAAPHGTRRSLAAITRDDLAEFHRAYYVPNNAIVAIAGGVSEEAALQAVRRYFGDWRPGALPPRADLPTPRLDHSTLQLREAPVGQAYFMLGYGIGSPRPDAYAVMEVLRALLGRGIGSRLYRTVREQAAAAYQVEAYHFALAAGGYLAACVAGAPDELEQTRRLIVAEFERLGAEPVGQAELRRARQYAVGAHALSHQRAKDRAFVLAWYEAVGLGAGFDRRYQALVSAVTAEQVQAAASRHFKHYALGLVLPSD